MQTQAIENIEHKDRSQLLRRVLRANAIFSTLSALVFLLFANPLTTLLGVPEPLALYVLGVGLLPFAWFVYHSAKQDILSNRTVNIILALDILWVVSSYLLIFSGIVAFTTVGQWLVGLLAEVVFIFAVLEFIGLRRLH